MYGKIIDGKLVIADKIIKGENWSINNPSVEQLIEKGYKEIVYVETKVQDGYKLVPVYTDGKTITVNYKQVELTEAEKRAKILAKIEYLERQQTPRIIRNAINGDEFAINKIKEIEQEIELLRVEL
jgi:hypothetical protein